MTIRSHKLANDFPEEVNRTISLVCVEIIDLVHHEKQPGTARRDVR
jgi:hypothetical protein